MYLPTDKILYTFVNDINLIEEWKSVMLNLSIGVRP